MSLKVRVEVEVSEPLIERIISLVLMNKASSSLGDMFKRPKTKPKREPEERESSTEDRKKETAKMVDSIFEEELKENRSEEDVEDAVPIPMPKSMQHDFADLAASMMKDSGPVLNNLFTSLMKQSMPSSAEEQD